MFKLNLRSTRLLLIAGALAIGLSLAFSAYAMANVLSSQAASTTTVTVPMTVGFEGFLVYTNGTSLNGVHDLTFRVYNVETGGAALWQETKDDVQVTNGLYAVELGISPTITVETFNGARWIGVQVDGGTELAPRTKVASVPFAINAAQAISATYADVLDGLDAATSGANAHVLATGSNGSITVSGSATITNGATITGSALVKGNATVNGSTTITGGLNVGTASSAGAGNVKMSGGLIVGTATGAAAGNVAMSGSITQSTALGCRVVGTEDQTISNSTWAALSFGAEVNDTGGCWSSGNPTRLYAPKAGYYMAGGSVYWKSNTSGVRIMRICTYSNTGTNCGGTARLASLRIHPNVDGLCDTTITTGMFYMDGVDDYIEIAVYQNSGSALDVAGGDSGGLQMNFNGWLVRIP